MLPTQCAGCGQDPAAGFATHFENGKTIRLCHDDILPVGQMATCYEKWQPSSELTEQDFFVLTNNREAK